MNKCPFCEEPIQWEIYSGFPGIRATLYCPNGDFISCEGLPTICVRDYIAACRSVGLEVNDEHTD